LSDEYVEEKPLKAVDVFAPADFTKLHVKVYALDTAQYALIEDYMVCYGSV
jgi:hypothetical protein